MTGSPKSIYRTRVQGHLDENRSEWLGGLAIEREPGGGTILTGEIVDQAALNAVLNRLHEMNIQLVSVEHVDQDDAVD